MGRIEFGSGHKDNQIIHFEEMLPRTQTSSLNDNINLNLQHTIP